MKIDNIVLDHGEGGAATDRLVREVFLSRLGSPDVLEDGAVVRGCDRIVMTTDTFVVHPLVFPGGDIGRLAISGTVNDLAVMGAEPRYLTAGFVLEEGLEIRLLEAMIDSMAMTAAEAGVSIVTGDTKVVHRGEADSMYVNTSGVGLLPPGRRLTPAGCLPGDRVIVSGYVGDHGIAVMIAREGFGISVDLSSDCQPLGDLAAALLDAAPGTRCMRDPTRGGLATTLIDFCRASATGMRIREVDIPVRAQVEVACSVLGLDPLYVACEGRLVAVVPPEQSGAALSALRANRKGRDAALIGEVVDSPKGLVVETSVGGLRPMVLLEGAQLPRIC